MLTRIIFTFIIFAGLAYYFNIDVRTVVDKSGAPAWLTAHGITTEHVTSSTSTTTP